MKNFLIILKWLIPLMGIIILSFFCYSMQEQITLQKEMLKNFQEKVIAQNSGIETEKNGEQKGARLDIAMDETGKSNTNRSPEEVRNTIIQDFSNSFIGQIMEISSNSLRIRAKILDRQALQTMKVEDNMLLPMLSQEMTIKINDLTRYRNLDFRELTKGDTVKIITNDDFFTQLDITASEISHF